MRQIEHFFPEDTFPEIYVDVMLLHIFQDSKTFSDSKAKATPEEINSQYEKVDHENKSEIAEFVKKWFVLPQNETQEIPLEKLPIDQHIHRLWNQLTRPADKHEPYSSLIPLPYPYVVPGGRFREIYYWDSYFTMLGLQLSGRKDLIKSMMANFTWQIETFGHIPNGNRSYFLSRSQPPFFSLMVNLLNEADDEVSALIEYLPAMLKEYSFWMDGINEHKSEHRRIVRLTDDQILNRYYDDVRAPRAESWAEDIKMYPLGHKFNEEFYRHLRAACESGWDFSSRWLSDIDKLESIHTLDIIPPDLNSLIYILERTIARSYYLQGDSLNGEDFDRKANTRAEIMQRSLWNEEGGYFADLLFNEKKFGTPSLAMMFPLYAGIATPEQAKLTITFIREHFLKPGGWVTTNQYTGQQWDAPNGWAPLQWITYEALKKYGEQELAIEGAKRWLTLNENVFKRTGRMMEKYNVEDLSLDAGGGEYPVQDGFGWTNGVYLALVNELNLLSAE